MKSSSAFSFLPLSSFFTISFLTFISVSLHYITVTDHATPFPLQLDFNKALVSPITFRSSHTLSSFYFYTFLNSLSSMHLPLGGFRFPITVASSYTGSVLCHFIVYFFLHHFHSLRSMLCVLWFSMFFLLPSVLLYPVLSFLALPCLRLHSLHPTRKFLIQTTPSYPPNSLSLLLLASPTDSFSPSFPHSLFPLPHSLPLPLTPSSS